MDSSNPTARGRWQATLEQVFSDLTRLPARNVHLVGPFENAGSQGLLAAYPPEQDLDLSAAYDGKAGEVRWRHRPELEGVPEGATDLSAWGPAEAWSVLYMYAGIEVDTPQIAALLTGSSAIVWAWANGQLALSPTIPRLESFHDDRVWIAL